MLRFLHAAALCLSCAAALCAQSEVPPEGVQETGQDASQKAQQPPAADPQAAGSTAAGDSQHIDKRVFGVIPNNRTVSGDLPYAPITARHKIVIALKDSFDWPSYLTGALFAGLYQLEDSNPSFGQGTAGYFRRFGTASADQVIGNMMTEGFVPALFHQDPRYFQWNPQKGTRKQRLWHAMTSTIVAPMDSGKKTFNFSEWGGNAIGAAISNAYYPDTRTAADNAEKLLISVGTDTFSNVMKEFWPDVKGWWQRKRSHPAPGVVAK